SLLKHTDATAAFRFWRRCCCCRGHRSTLGAVETSAASSPASAPPSWASFVERGRQHPGRRRRAHQQLGNHTQPAPAPACPLCPAAQQQQQQQQQQHAPPLAPPPPHPVYDTSRRSSNGAAELFPPAPAPAALWAANRVPTAGPPADNRATNQHPVGRSVSVSYSPPLRAVAAPATGAGATDGSAHRPLLVVDDDRGGGGGGGRPTSRGTYPASGNSLSGFAQQPNGGGGGGGGSGSLSGAQNAGGKQKESGGKAPAARETAR
ncbi:unnamed protein product, partial [Ectocarpus fasciculatus]